MINIFRKKERGIIRCDRCGYNIVSYDVENLKSKKETDSIESISFKYINKKLGKIKSDDEMKCPCCKSNYHVVITNMWRELQKNREWDRKENK